MPESAPEFEPDDDCYAIFDENGPLDPLFVTDAVQALMRAFPLAGPEGELARDRHRQAALIALRGMHPRDPIELMMSVLAVSAYQSACANWRTGLQGSGNSSDRMRHIAAATSARTLVTLLSSLERRQAKPLLPTTGRHETRNWPGKAAAIALSGV